MSRHCGPIRQNGYVVRDIDAALNDPIPLMPAALGDFTHPISSEVEEAQAAHVPVHLRHPVWWSRDGGVHAERLGHVYRSGKLAGYNLYETGAMYDAQDLDHNGRLRFYPGLTEGIRAGIERLGLL